MPPPLLTRREPVSLDELVAGCTERTPFLTGDSKSGTTFERLLISGEPHILKYLHVDDDWIMRASGDLRARPWVSWQAGLMDAVPPCIETGVVGVASGLGRNGWGAAVLMRDVGAHLVPEGDEPVALETHRQFLDHMAALSAHFWGFQDTIGRRDSSGGATRCSRSSASSVPKVYRRSPCRAGSASPNEHPPTSRRWFEICGDPSAFIRSMEQTPMTFLHGDWKMGNLGTTPDGRTILLDWAGPGEGPPCGDLGWYLALNRARIPETKEEAIAAFRGALERHGVETSGWWDQQMQLALLGNLMLGEGPG